MEVVICEDGANAAALAANAIVTLVNSRPEAVLGLATGSSPLGVYDALGAAVAEKRTSLARVRGFLLDEYLGLPEGHQESYRAVIAREFIDKVDIDPANVVGPYGSTTDPAQACADYELAIAAAGGVDLQLLGIGTDGHIAFNEPGSSLGSRTRVKTLTQQTRADNARFFDGDIERVPQHCLTQGIGTILEAKHLVLMAQGRAKAQAVRDFVEGPVSASCPASALQLHPHVSVLVDPQAASALERSDYYRDTYTHKPDWQPL